MSGRTRVNAMSSSSQMARALSKEQVQGIGHAIHLWLGNKRGSQRAWDQMIAACKGIRVSQVKGKSEVSRLVRTWLQYLEAERRTHHSSSASDQFDRAYTIWLNWKPNAQRVKPARRARHGRR